MVNIIHQRTSDLCRCEYTRLSDTGTRRRRRDTGDGGECGRDCQRTRL